MLKTVTVLKRKAGMPVDEFQAYWLHEHPKVVTRMPGVRRYVQSHCLPSGYRKGEPVHDGIAEVWFDGMDNLRALPGSQVYADVVADEERFLDRASMGLLLVDERVVKDAPWPRPGLKNIEFVHRRPDLDVETFQRHWREVHGPIAARIGTLRRYVQNHVKPGAYKAGRQPVYDGLAITWFDSLEDMRASAASAEYATTREDEPNFLPPGKIPIIVAQEHVIVA